LPDLDAREGADGQERDRFLAGGKIRGKVQNQDRRRLGRPILKEAKPIGFMHGGHSDYSSSASTSKLCNFRTKGTNA
jgi:hypothetical protein